MKFDDWKSNASQVWSLIPAEATPQLPHDALGLGPLPLYDENLPGQPPAQAQHQYERDDFGTIVTEVTIVTTRKRYRVEDA